MSSEYYTAGKAIAVLKVPQYQFFRMVERGEIERVKLPLRKRSAYRKEQIDALAEQLSQVKVISA